MAAGLLVVADATGYSTGVQGNLTVGEFVLVEDLRVTGAHTMTVRGQGSVVAGDLAGKAFAVISGSTSSSTVGNAIGAALASSSIVVITMNVGTGLVPVLQLVNTASLNTYRASDGGIGTVDIPDTAFDGGTTANNASWFSPSSAGDHLKSATFGAGAVGIAVRTSNAAEFPAVAYPAGSQLANATSAPGGRAFFTGTSYANRSTIQRTVLLATITALSSTSVPQPTVTVNDRHVRAGQGVQVSASATVSGDTINSYAWTTTDPGGAACFSSTTVQSPIFTPTSGSGDVGVSCLATAGQGGQRTGAGIVSVIPITQVVSTPVSAAVGASTVDETGAAVSGASLAAKLADAFDITYVKATSAGVVCVVRYATATAGTGTGGARRVTLQREAGTTTASFSIELVDAGAFTDAQVASGSGTIIGSAVTGTLTNDAPRSVSNIWSTAASTAMAAGRLCGRTTLTALS